jgi:hypothetical protein
MAPPRALTAGKRARVQRLAGAGAHTDTEIAEMVGVSLSTVRRELGREPPPRPRPRPQELGPEDEDATTTIDWTSPPLELARALLRHATETIAKLEPESPRLNPTRTEARNLAGLIARLEQEQAKEATPDEAERQRRRDDGDTRKKIEQYVEQALQRALTPSPAAPHGRCPTCSGTLSPTQRAALLGTPT